MGVACYFEMKISCFLIVLIFVLLHAKGGQMDVRELEIGEPFNDYEYDGRNRVRVVISLQLNSNKINISTAHNRTVKLDFEKTYEFDNGSTIHRLMQFDEHHTNTSSTKIILTGKTQNKYKIYNYEADEDISFNCTRAKEAKWRNLDSLHWIKVKDENVSEILESNYYNKTIIYKDKTTPKHDGIKLICLYLECDENVDKKEIKCIRHVLHYIKLEMCSGNCTIGFQTPDRRNGTVLGGIAALSVVVLILLAAVTWYYTRRAKLKRDTSSGVQYIEVEFSETPSSRPPTKDEIVYSEVKGVLSPAMNKY